MKKGISILLLLLLNLSIIVKSQQGGGTAGFSSNTCKQLPEFARKLGFNVSLAAFSTTEKKTKGIVFMEYTNSPNRRVYQHPTWKLVGTLGPIVTTEEGVVFTAPLPSVNILENLPMKQNIIYRINPNTGEMGSFLDLPKAKNPGPTNSFGILGMDYSCDKKVMYVSSVSGSDLKTEYGRIFAISLNQGKPEIINQLNNIDGFAVCYGTLNSEKRLFFGRARTSDVYSIAVDEKGKFIGKPRFELTLVQLGPRGDDRARKIRFVNGDLVISGVEFFFNLIAPSEKQETQYTFRYSEYYNQWQLVGLK
ncbi:MAG: hypothetical protein IPP65_03380 [Chlorobi bacterium]|jgi:hypothetical protein|nr:hypothetical protein [Chlorobiota bacterium]